MNPDEKKNALCSGWKAAVAWIFVAAVFYEIVARPTVAIIISWFGLELSHLPEISSNIWRLVTGILGLGV